MIFGFFDEAQLVLRQLTDLGMSAKDAADWQKDMQYETAYYSCKDQSGKASRSIQDNILFFHVFAGDSLILLLWCTSVKAGQLRVWACGSAESF